MFLCTIGLRYILEFIAGAITFGAFVAIIVVVSMSSAIPPELFPMTLAVAGATRKNQQLCRWIYV